MAVNTSILLVKKNYFLALFTSISNTTFNFLWGAVYHKDTMLPSLYENSLIQTWRRSLQWSVFSSWADLQGAWLTH